jgi:tRNA(fMet)-specific endonuclease VapC
MQALYLLDTNAVIYILRERSEGFLQQFAKLEQGEAAISAITYGELFFGLAKALDGLKELRLCEN